MPHLRHKGERNWPFDEWWTNLFSARFCSSSVLPSPVDYMEQGGRGLGLIHECPARTFRLMETGLKLPIISAICLLAHSCPGPLCIIAHNSVFVGGMRCRHPDTGGRQQGVWGQTHSLLLPPPDAAAAAYQL